MKRPTSTPPPLYLTIPEVCVTLGLGRTKVYDLINKEGLPTVKFGTARRVPVEKFHRWLAQREQIA